MSPLPGLTTFILGPFRGLAPTATRCGPFRAQFSTSQMSALPLATGLVPLVAGPPVRCARENFQPRIARIPRINPPYYQSTYTNSFNPNSTWQKSASAASRLSALDRPRTACSARPRIARRRPARHHSACAQGHLVRPAHLGVPRCRIFHGRISIRAAKCRAASRTCVLFKSNRACGAIVVLDARRSPASRRARRTAPSSAPACCA